MSYWDRVKPDTQDTAVQEKVEEIKQEKRTRHAKKAANSRWGKK